MVEKSGRDSAKDSGANSSPTDEDESLPPKSSASTASATKSRSSVGSTKKASSSMANSSSPAVVKRKQAKRSATQGASNVDRDDSDHGIDPNNVEIDPDEPTYCLCDQVKRDIQILIVQFAQLFYLLCWTDYSEIHFSRFPTERWLVATTISVQLNGSILVASR